MRNGTKLKLGGDGMQCAKSRTCSSLNNRREREIKMSHFLLMGEVKGVV